MAVARRHADVKLFCCTKIWKKTNCRRMRIIGEVQWKPDLMTLHNFSYAVWDLCTIWSPAVNVPAEGFRRSCFVFVAESVVAKNDSGVCVPTSWKGIKFAVCTLCFYFEPLGLPLPFVAETGVFFLRFFGDTGVTAAADANNVFRIATWPWPLSWTTLWLVSFQF